ncbi:MAG: hypothetical protein KKC96_02890 [Nanoarchaeota archaeon]|nr:hypothetical protein [Nanoarchaeota archaeon]
METLDIEKMSEDIVALKKELEEMKKSIQGDVEFAVRTELAWQSHDRGEFTSYSKEEFLKRLEGW